MRKLVYIRERKINTTDKTSKRNKNSFVGRDMGRIWEDLGGGEIGSKYIV